ncbi:beta-glucosidase [Penicillium lividum]|nr:beta-glucosidase [Penicillium lividum]
MLRLPTLSVPHKLYCKYNGVPIVGAFAWPLIDNNEWGTYAQRYGMQTVDRKTQTRRFKRSMFDYIDAFQEVVKGHN